MTQVTFGKILKIFNRVIAPFSDLHIVAIGQSCEQKILEILKLYIYGKSIKNNRTHVFLCRLCSMADTQGSCCPSAAAVLLSHFSFPFNKF